MREFMMSVKEYATDTNCSIAEILKKCEELGIDVRSGEDELSEDDIIMLDNMTLEQMKECVDYIAGRAIVEASGNVHLNTVADIAATGVDIISSSAIVAKAPTLDLGFDCK
jgi:nicotinate-nucleotide pyrophosphorylase